jgi:pilus assembly protein CpaB
MRILFLFILLLGIGLAGTAGYLTLLQFQGSAAEINRLQALVDQNIKTDTVVVAKNELTYGDILSAEDVEIVKFPADGIPETAFKTMEELFGAEGEDKPDRVVLRTMEPTEVLSKNKVSDFGEDAGVASRLAFGMRAFTLKVDVASGVSGFLRPGDKIDVFWTGRAGRETVSRLILDGIQLIAIDQKAEDTTNRPVVARTVTVAVTPQVVGALVQAQATGNLQLSLRGIGDDGTSGVIEVNQDGLLGREKVLEEKKTVCTIKSRKGGEVTTIEIPCPTDQ